MKQPHSMETNFKERKLNKCPKYNPQNYYGNKEQKNKETNSSKRCTLQFYIVTQHRLKRDDFASHVLQKMDKFH